MNRKHACNHDVEEAARIAAEARAHSIIHGTTRVLCTGSTYPHDEKKKVTVRCASSVF